MPVDQLADTIPGMSVNECALMDRIATGDPGALEALYHRFHPKLARFLWRLIGRREGLEEIINDTFVDVWKGRSRKGSGLYRLNSDSPCYLPTKWAVDSRRSRRSPAFPLRLSTLGCFVRARSYATTYPR